MRPPSKRRRTDDSSERDEPRTPEHGTTSYVAVVQDRPDKTKSSRRQSKTSSTVASSKKTVKSINVPVTKNKQQSDINFDLFNTDDELEAINNIVEEETFDVSGIHKAAKIAKQSKQDDFGFNPVPSTSSQPDINVTGSNHNNKCDQPIPTGPFIAMQPQMPNYVYNPMSQYQGFGHPFAFNPLTNLPQMYQLGSNLPTNVPSSMTNQLPSNVRSDASNPFAEQLSTFSSTINNILGKVDTFNLPFTTLDRGIPDAMRRNIWEGIYVDFRNILDITEPKFNAESRKKVPQNIESFPKWLKAFNIYASCYLQKFPEQCIQMLNYQSHICTLSESMNCSGWKEYDETFRRHRQSDKRSWDQKDINLWNEILTKTSRWVNPSTVVKKPTGSVKNDTRVMKYNPIFSQCQASAICFRYQAELCTYENCKFRHICRICSQDHPAKKCNKNVKTFNIKK